MTAREEKQMNARMNFKKTGFMATLIILVLLFVNGNLQAADMPVVERYVLDNGMTFLLLPRDSSSVSFEVRVKVGSIDEHLGKTGLSHMLEHMMFKGTRTIGTIDYPKEKKLLDEMDSVAEKLKTATPQESKTLNEKMAGLIKEASALQIPGELDRLYSLAGGTGLNASTSADLTSYHVSLPKGRIEFWAAIESERIRKPVFREFYTERDVVLKERSQRVDLSDEGTLFEKFLLHSFETCPYRYPVIGFREDIEGLTTRDLENYYFKHYIPGNMIVAIVGGFDPIETKKILARYFGKIPNRDKPGTIVMDEPVRRADIKISISSKEQPSIIMGVQKPKLPGIDDTCFDVIEQVLTGGETSRLVKALVKKGLASDVSAYNGLPGSRLDNLFLITANPVSPHTNKELEDIIWKEIDMLNKEGITKDELDQTVRVLTKSILSSLETDAGAASVLSTYEILAGDWRYVFKNLEVLQGLTLEQIKVCSAKYLVRGKATTAYLED
jgi:predicted Zn-dependent peptidase